MHKDRTARSTAFKNLYMEAVVLEIYAEKQQLGPLPGHSARAGSVTAVLIQQELLT